MEALKCDSVDDSIGGLRRKLGLDKDGKKSPKNGSIKKSTTDKKAVTEVPEEDKVVEEDFEGLPDSDIVDETLDHNIVPHTKTRGGRDYCATVKCRDGSTNDQAELGAVKLDFPNAFRRYIKKLKSTPEGQGRLKKERNLKIWKLPIVEKVNNCDRIIVIQEMRVDDTQLASKASFEVTWDFGYKQSDVPYSTVKKQWYNREVLDIHLQSNNIKLQRGKFVLPTEDEDDSSTEEEDGWDDDNNGGDDGEEGGDSDVRNSNQRQGTTGSNAAGESQNPQDGNKEANPDGVVVGKKSG